MVMDTETLPEPLLIDRVLLLTMAMQHLLGEVTRLRLELEHGPGSNRR